MEAAAVQLPQYVVFDLSGSSLRCFTPAPAVEHVGVPFVTQLLGLEALLRTRLSRADLATQPPSLQLRTAMNNCDREEISDPDTMSDAGTSVVQVAEESEDEADSVDELLFEESFVRKIDALAELVGMKGACEPAAVLGEVVRVLREMDRKMGSSVCATRAV